MESGGWTKIGAMNWVYKPLTDAGKTAEWDRFREGGAEASADVAEASADYRISSPSSGSEDLSAATVFAASSSSGSCSTRAGPPPLIRYRPNWRDLPSNLCGVFHQHRIREFSYTGELLRARMACSYKAAAVADSRWRRRRQYTAAVKEAADVARHRNGQCPVLEKEEELEAQGSGGAPQPAESTADASQLGDLPTVSSSLPASTAAAIRET